MSARNWTLEQRQRQSEAIRQWKPWKHSTGPRSIEGKAKVARNAFKGGALIKLRKAIKGMNQFMYAQKWLINQ